MNTRRVILEHADTDVARGTQGAAQRPGGVVVVNDQSSRGLLLADGANPTLGVANCLVSLKGNPKGLLDVSAQLAALACGRGSVQFRDRARARAASGLPTLAPAATDQMEVFDRLRLAAFATALLGLRGSGRVLTSVDRQRASGAALLALVASAFASAVVVGRELLNRLDFAALAALLRGHGVFLGGQSCPASAEEYSKGSTTPDRSLGHDSERPALSTI